MNPQAQQYVDDALAFARENFLHTQKVNWAMVRATVCELAQDAQTTTDTHPAVHWMAGHLSSFLEMPHTFFQEKSTPHFVSQTTGEQLLFEPRGERLEEVIGYVWIPTVEADHVSGNRFYADAVHDLIEQIDADNVRSWIVDLRDDHGGNCWPMLAGLSPILGNGMCGMFIQSSGNHITWNIQDGSSLYDSEVVRSVSRTPYTLKNPQPRVAVLVGPGTGSAGEVVVLAFRGRENTRFFGANTSGYSTANEAKFFEDGACLIVTAAALADRNGCIAVGPIVPDEIVPDGWNSLELENDTCVQSAIAWLKLL
jgi:carboxyl-terminal processing protease